MGWIPVLEQFGELYIEIGLDSENGKVLKPNTVKVYMKNKWDLVDIVIFHICRSDRRLDRYHIWKSVIRLFKTTSTRPFSIYFWLRHILLLLLHNFSMVQLCATVLNMNIDGCTTRYAMLFLI